MANSSNPVQPSQAAAAVPPKSSGTVTVPASNQSLFGLIDPQIGKLQEVFGDKAAAPKPAAEPAKPATTGFPDIPAKGPQYRYKSTIRVKIGTRIFDSLAGEIFLPAHVRLSTYQHNTAKFVLSDPNDTVRLSIKDEKECEIEIGFGDGPRRNKLIGAIYYVGRRNPDGCEVMVVDLAYQMQSNTGSSVQFNGEKAANTNSKETASGTLQVSDLAKVQALKGAGAANSEAANIVTTGKLTGATTQLDLSGAAPASGTVPVSNNSTNTFTNLMQTLTNVSQQNQQQRVNQQQTTSTQIFTDQQPNLRFKNTTPTKTTVEGGVRLQQSQMQSATNQAALQGDVVVASGRTVEQVAPGQGESTGIVLDYKNKRYAFIGKPLLFKRNPIQLQSGFGSITVGAWNPQNKEMMRVTVNTPVPGGYAVPGGVIAVPEWGQVKLKDALFQGSAFTWADVTHGGERIPTKAVMGRAIEIAKRIQPLIDKTGKKWSINSWYRRPEDNARAGGASGSRHLSGDAVDVNFPGMFELHKQLYDSWPGGLAICPGSFVHFDARPSGKARWTYS